MIDIDDMIEEEFGSTNPEQQYLFFVCHGDMYAIKSLQAQEIVEYSDITKVPMVQNCVVGVTNIRGNIVPVIDLTVRLGLGKTQIHDRTSIIVINYDYQNSTIPIGIMIDEVYEVDHIDEEDIVERPLFGSAIDPKYIKNMGKYHNKYLPILNIETLLHVDEIATIMR